MKKLKIAVVAAVVLFLSSTGTEAQGPCFGKGTWFTIQGTPYFVCPTGGATEACGYPCGPQEN